MSEINYDVEWTDCSGVEYTSTVEVEPLAQGGWELTMSRGARHPLGKESPFLQLLAEVESEPNDNTILPVIQEVLGTRGCVHRAVKSVRVQGSR